jgi:hypothetical protein
MAPSSGKIPRGVKPVISQILPTLKKNNFSYIEGAKLVEYGDFVCSICRQIQGAAFGIAISGGNFPASSLCNIFWEKGLMQGFGKPVILFLDESINLPSDFVRSYAIFLNTKNWNTKFDSLLKNIKRLPDKFLNVTGDIAFEAGDYERASKYYMDAYLIDESGGALKRIEEIMRLLKDPPSGENGLRRRLFQTLQAFVKGTSKNTAKAEKERRSQKPIHS